MKKYVSHVKAADFFQDYESFISDRYKRLKPVSRSLFRKVAGEVNAKVMEEIRTNNYNFKIPFTIGHISIVAKKRPLDSNKLPIDWQATKSLWAEDIEAKKEKKLIYHINEHTNGVYFKYSFSKHAIGIKNLKIYSFIPSRNNKRLLAACAKEGIMSPKFSERWR